MHAITKLLILSLVGSMLFLGSCYKKCSCKCEKVLVCRTIFMIQWSNDSTLLTHKFCSQSSVDWRRDDVLEDSVEAFIALHETDSTFFSQTDSVIYEADVIHMDCGDATEPYKSQGYFFECYE